VLDYLKKIKKEKADGPELVQIILDSFIDARLFGSSLAFAEGQAEGEKWKPSPIPKTLTGPVQFNMGEVLHEAEEVDVYGTSTFASQEIKETGTFTTLSALRYALIGFSGVANQHSAKISRLTQDDYELFLKALWHGVRSAANTRTKVGQIPHLLVSVEYKPGEEFQFGRLHDYVKLAAISGKSEKIWASPQDFRVDLQLLLDRVKSQADRLEKVKFAQSPDLQLAQTIPTDWEKLDVEKPLKKT
jgi:CRISPR-associated protein Csh2